MYKAIAPYNQEEIEEALDWLSDKQAFIRGVQYFYPNWSEKIINQKLKQCNSCADFQVAFIEPLIGHLIQNTISHLEIKGLEHINKEDHHLYISNHRGIFLDSALLQYTLYYQGYRFTEISLGDNLIVNDVMERVAKLNNMFTVFRTGSKMQRLRNAKELSAYLRYAISEKGVSAWIAQGNGRTKDGNDRTFPGLVNMLLMSRKSDLQKSLEDLQIVISSISFEYEPCDLEKATELQTKEDTGIYEKTQYENIYSIVKGIEEQKGNVCLHLEKLNTANIDFSGSKKEVITSIVREMDRLVHQNFKLFKTHYMAYDLLHNTQEFKEKYNSEEKQAFEFRIQSSSPNPRIQQRLLQMYAQPVLNKKG